MTGLFRDYDVTRYSAFKTRAKSEYFFEFADRAQIPELLESYAQVRSQKLPIVHIGSGTNCLFAFDAFPGLIIRHNLKGIRQEGRTLAAMSGELTSTLATRAFSEMDSRSMIPWIGLPGTVGGAVVGNAGCFWLSVADILIQAEVLDLETGAISVYKAGNFEYRYRNSHLKGQSSKIVLEASFDLVYEPKTNTHLLLSPAEMQALRKTKQPPGPSCGSYFTNPAGYSAGALIDQAGLKGKTIGGMQISPHHANFFINKGGATFSDVLELAEIAKRTVKERFGIDLYEEVRIITA